MEKQITCRFDIERLEEDGQVEGVASIFGTFIEQDRVILLPRSFNRTLNSWKEKGGIPMTLDHLDDQFIGVFHEGVENNVGLRVKGKINKAIERGAIAYAKAKAGEIGGLSVHFILVRDKTEIKKTQSGPIFYAREVQLKEIALTAKPADAAAKIESVRMSILNKEAWVQAKAALLIAEDYDPDKAVRIAKAMWDAMDIGTESLSERVERLYALIKPIADPKADASTQQQPVIQAPGETIATAANKDLLEMHQSLARMWRHNGTRRIADQSRRTSGVGK